jgi:hypothetical protein
MGDGVQAIRTDAWPHLTEADIIRALNGLPLTAIARTMAGMGACDVSVVDLAESGLPNGTPLGFGLLADEARIVIIFGMPQGFMRPARRFRIIASHRNGQVVDVLQIERVAK